MMPLLHASFEVLDTVPCEVQSALERGLVANAIAQKAPPYKKMDLSIVHRGEDGTLCAGLTGKTFWNGLYVDTLWVEEKIRGQNVGTGLMKAAEAEAIKRGCLGAYLWTESFEARGFYAKLGYKEFVVMDDFPIGHQRIGFMKRFE